MTYKCPFCKTACRDDGTIEKNIFVSFEHTGVREVTGNDSCPMVLSLSRCPACNRVSVELLSHHESKEKVIAYSYPPENCIAIPDYVPHAIRMDYIESVPIVDASPKASATLSRRCLQGMIRDFWGIKRGRLVDEINELQDKIPSSQWSAINALRKIGNIGAHMEKDVNLIVDVDPSEAKSLLRLIELLIDKWYISRHDEEMLLSDITKMADEKESIRRFGASDANRK